MGNYYSWELDRMIEKDNALRALTETTPSRSLRQRIIEHVNAAQQSLNAAYSDSVNTQPLMADIPCIQELAKVAKDLTGILQAVSKLRGL